ncbi:MAG: RnfABCDGE type electron transport complex subunit B [Lachnospiraceae bacterium]|nr:RnfABCDGE type electron transport complex subunit B [Lachnospiraceae bacterium]
MTGIITAAAVVAVVGIFIGIFLGIAAIWFHVDTDPREEEILQSLPGNNCGGCGFPGCSGLAAAIVKGEARVNGCPVGGEEVAEKIAAVMGVEAEKEEKLVAFIKCQGDCNKTKIDYEYSGTRDCSMMAFVPGGGPKSCNYGCLGYGDCVKVCTLQAISIVNGIARVDKDLCQSCGSCVKACPKSLIEMIPYKAERKVACDSRDKGPQVLKKCEVGCIGCGICVKNCPKQAITVQDFLAKIDYSLCTNCGICKEKCPKKAII